MSTEGLTYSQYVYSINNDNARNLFIKLEEAVRTGEVTPVEFASKVEELTGKTVSIHRSASGNVLGYTLNNTSTVTTTNAINSNVSTVARGNVSMPVSTGIDSITGKATASRLAGVGTKLATGAALVGTAAMCVSAGIALGKTVDSVLYNLNPDFWDSNNMGALNPETWNSITAGDDSLGAKLLNVIFGFDDNGNGQAYMDADALAYMALYMKNQGVFAPSVATATLEDTSILHFPNITQPVLLQNYNDLVTTNRWYQSNTSSWYDATRTHSINPEPTSYFALLSDEFSGVSSAYYYWGLFATLGTFPSSNNIEMTTTTVNERTGVETVRVTTDGTSNYKVMDGRPGNASLFASNQLFTYNNPSYNPGVNMQPTSINIGSRINSGSNSDWVRSDIAKIILYGTIHEGGSIEGISNQQGAQLPNTDSWNDVASTRASLEQQYPDMFNNAINYPVMQDDGTVKNYTYVPVPMPNLNYRTDTQPTTGTDTQTSTEINPITQPQEFIDTITKIITNPYPKTDTDINTSNPPQNPTDIGDGSSPIGVVPVGSASSLWKIYHPTQSEVDSFGGWLWSSNFIDQILKIFNNPMEAVIGLHKVYATPIDAGTSTIKVGYLDSNVSSAYIEQQYVTVSCGSVNLNEQFGNVFDYSPYTDIQLYLPFVGIVPLNVNDVMRSNISVDYGVDVITGACLAMVKVSRDGNNSVLYQYSGNCAVQYPISSGSYMGIVSSIISVAGGVAATVASGGAAAPLALGAAGGLLNAHTNVQHSGGFSGNSGAMGGKKPYLIITRPITKIAEYDETMNGYPANSYTTVGECSGYVKANNAHVINVPASNEELEEIYNYLVSGIIV